MREILCNVCNETKEICEFYKAPTKRGFMRKCKDCHKETSGQRLQMLRRSKLKEARAEVPKEFAAMFRELGMTKFKKYTTIMVSCEARGL